MTLSLLLCAWQAAAKIFETFCFRTLDLKENGSAGSVVPEHEHEVRVGSSAEYADWTTALLYFKFLSVSHSVL